MTEEQQRIKIAESVGYVQTQNGAWKKANGLVIKDPAWLPDYLNDLNAMHEVENTLNDHNARYDYATALARVTIGEEFDDEGFSPNGFGYFAVLQATAAQRAEAYLRTIGKWID